MRYDVERALSGALRNDDAPPVPLDAIRSRAQAHATAQRARGSIAMIAAMLAIALLMALMVDRVCDNALPAYGVTAPVPMPTES